MKKRFLVYGIIWAICLAVFNVIAFVTPKEIAGDSKFDGAFWIGYIFITIAFFGQLVCAFFAFKAESLKKTFYRLPMISISYTGLIVMLIAGSLCMAIPNLPEWVGIIVCVLVLAFSVITVIKAAAVSEIVSNVDEKVRAKIAFIKALTVDAQNLMNTAKTEALCAETKKVFEAIRYSDPMSDEALADIESQIQSQFNAFSDAVQESDEELAHATADSLIETLINRNQKCKLLK